MEVSSDSLDFPDDAEELQLYVEENGVSGIEGFFRERLERWRDIAINIGITGNSGTGKSSFVNRIRGVNDRDPNAAKIGVTESTTVPQSFLHPTNEKIKFWDLPGIGTPNYPDLETYCEKVKLETYDTFLIFTAGRFTKNDLELAKKIKSVGKKFFFIRTKIDIDVQAEERRLEENFNEESMLKEIRHDCCNNLGGLVEREGDIFLISNHYPTKWEFSRLTQSILDVLPIRQREALTLSLTCRSADMLKKKIEVLKGRVWMVSGASAAAALVPLPGLSIAVDLKLITNEISFYRSQLGLPEQGSPVFSKLDADNKEKVRRFILETAEQVSSFRLKFSKGKAYEKYARFIPYVGLVIASGMSFRTIYCFLHRCLTEMEKTAVSFLEETASSLLASEIHMDDLISSDDLVYDAEEPKGYAEKSMEMLEGWEDIDINIGITGDTGAGKSSFINTIRGLDDYDARAAQVGVTKTTVPQSFPHPTNEKIKFWDLPGIDTPNYPDLETYCEKVKLETYDTFLIFKAGRFTENDRKLAKKIKSVGKKFFFIRTKIDENIRAERRKRSFNEEIMLARIRRDYFQNLSGLVENEVDIFLISNHYPAKWDFARLTQSILDVLPIRQREALTLSLSVLTSMSADILKRKIEVLRSRIWKVSRASAAAALIPLPGLSIAVDLTLITNEISFYRSQLGLPEEGSALFNTLTADNQERVRRFFLVTAAQLGSFMALYSSESVVEEWVRFIPFVGQAIASVMSFGTTYYFLNRCLTEMEKTALSVLDEINAMPACGRF